jgi:DUF1365 family protein
VTAALYPCEIIHVRAHPIRRTFRYHSYLWLVDLDDLPQVPPPLRLFARFRSRDHFGDPACSIRANVDAYLWVTAQVSALIRWQGIRLAARRLPILPRLAHHPQEGAL